jgi:hypothetical protein
MNIERAWYETSPYLYATTGALSAWRSDGSWLMNGSALALFCAAVTIIGLRWIYRRDNVQTLNDSIDQRKYVSSITQDLFFDANGRRETTGRSSSSR